MNNRLKVKALYIELTQKCNLHCTHCYNDSGKDCMEIKYDTLLSLLDDALFMNVEAYSISGGEPLMADNFMRILFEITNRGFSKISIVTNGLLLDNKKIKNILEINKNIKFQISLDGLGESHDIIRGNGTFSKLMTTINLLRENNCDFIFHTLIHKYNYNQIGDIIDFAKKNGAHQIDFALLKRKGRGKDNYSEISLSCEETLELFKKYYLNENFIDKKNIHINFPKIFFGSCPLFGSEPVEVFARIDALGNVYICQNFDGKENILGNIYNEHLQDIIVDKRIDTQKKHFEKSTHYLKCNSCFLNSICGKGCPGVEYTDFDDLNCSLDCNIRKKYALEKILLFNSGISKNKTISEDLKNDNTCY